MPTLIRELIDLPAHVHRGDFVLRLTEGIQKPDEVLRRRLDLFSTDTLIDMLARLGLHVRFVLKSSRRRLKVA